MDPVWPDDVSCHNQQSDQSAVIHPAALIRGSTGQVRTQSNLNRVAAGRANPRSAGEDIGLMVELKRWIARDAANEQIVEDSTRRTRRSLSASSATWNWSYATALLQRYGYLTPTLNPDRPWRQRELCCRRVRAGWLKRKPGKRRLPCGAATRRASTEAECDPRQDRCPEQGASARRRINQGAPARSPALSEPDQTAPEMPIRPSLPPQVLRANANQTDPGSALQPGFADGLGKSPLGSGTLANTSFSGIGGDGAAGLSPSMIDSILSGKSGIPPEVLSGLAKSNANEPPLQAQTFETLQRKPPFRSGAENMDPVRMVHRPNPYADVPSLYDMYVQASVRRNHGAIWIGRVPQQQRST